MSLGTPIHSRTVHDDASGTPHESPLPAAPLTPSEAALRGIGRLDAALLEALGRRLGPVPLRLRLWQGTQLALGPPPLVATVSFADRATLSRVLWNPELWFGEAYASGRVEVHGDLVGALEATFRAAAGRGGGLWPRLRRLGSRRNTARRSRRNVHEHYDLGNDFYRLWLDPEMVYTCAYYPDPDSSLERAQLAKLDLVCRKLRLQPGEEVVEAGCGWGALALHMARRYGVRVRAYNLSSEQLRHARLRARAEGLDEAVSFVEGDYREITGRFDVFVSVGMLEHVGLGSYAALAGVLQRCLKGPRARGLLHFIGRHQPRPLGGWILRRIFPGAYPPSLSQVFSQVLEPAGLAVSDVENLRPHYARTLAHWRQRFEAQAQRVEAMFSPEFARAWHLYLAGSEAAFRVGSLQLFQLVFERPDGASLYWTRDEMPRPAAEA
jgi:cyclopropane-fatty-acyl-phospholipid synthase